MKKSRSRHTVQPPPLPPESAASLASGMTDDFNDILTTLMGACSLIDRDDPVNRDLLHYVALIRAYAEHAAALSDLLMRAGTPDHENCCSCSHINDSGCGATSIRDKKAIDDIVSAKKDPGDTAS